LVSLVFLTFSVLLSCISILLSIQWGIFIGENPHPNAMQCSFASKQLKQKKDTVKEKKNKKVKTKSFYPLAFPVFQYVLLFCFEQILIQRRMPWGKL